MEKDAQARIKELESELIQMQLHMAHQESLLQDLSDVLIEQQKEIDSLRKVQKQMREYLQSLTSAPGTIRPV